MLRRGKGSVMQPCPPPALPLLLLSLYFERKVASCKSCFPQEQRQAEISHDSTVCKQTCNQWPLPIFERIPSWRVSSKKKLLTLIWKMYLSLYFGLHNVHFIIFWVVKCTFHYILVWNINMKNYRGSCTKLLSVLLWNTQMYWQKNGEIIGTTIWTFSRIPNLKEVKSKNSVLTLTQF